MEEWAILRGDYVYLWLETVKSYAHIPYAWDASLNSGLGVPGISTLWLTSYLFLTAYFTYLGLSWAVISYVFWVLPTVTISFITAVLLYRYFFPNQKLISLFAGIIYVVNSYFLMILGGGQVGVALAYAFAPLVVLAYVNLIKTQSLRMGLITGLALSLQTLFDPRVVYITLLVVLVIGIFQLTIQKHVLKFLYITVFLPFATVVALHAFWILPLLIFGGGSTSVELGNLSSFRFFSFADFSHTIALLHPNWPENLFGKVYFMQAQFLLLPIAAFSTLLFFKKSNSHILLPCILLLLLGAFLAKGTNDPFGVINEYIFQYIPGMDLFRDPSKFYILTAIAYTILLPFLIGEIAEKLKFIKFVSGKAVVIASIFFWLLLHISTFSLGNPLQHFVPKQIPAEYKELKTFLTSSDNFYRTLWVPTIQRYRYFSDARPAISFTELSKPNEQNLKKKFNEKGFQKKVQDAAIKYVIIPYDSEGDIFLNDRKYDDRLYQKVVKELDGVKWLKKKKQIGKIIVYEVPDSKDHFWIEKNGQSKFTYTMSNPTQYILTSKNGAISGNLIFSERFDPNWSAIVNGNKVKSREYADMFNSFSIKNAQTVTIVYEPQAWVVTGLIISAISLVLVCSLILFTRKS